MTKISVPAKWRNRFFKPQHVASLTGTYCGCCIYVQANLEMPPFAQQARILPLSLEYFVH